ncbi:MAG: hypothetical protein ACYCW6_18490 [Candidatus Xenobia bacterium]
MKKAGTMEEVLEALASQIHGELTHLAALDGSSGPGAPSWRGSVEGRPVTIALFEGHLTLVVEATPTFTLALHHEGRWDWLRKVMGQLDDYEIGQEQLDREFIIGGQPRAHVVSFLKRPEVQRRLEAMDGFISLGAEHGMVRGTWPTQREPAWTAEELLRLTRGLAELAKLAEET